MENNKINKINRDFFNRNARDVAKDLLGVIIARRINNNRLLKARIVETEAYFDENDPASRARQNGDLRKTMKMKPGTILVYGVHNNWLINFVTSKEGVAEAVLIRALEPLNFNVDCSGPGKLTKALLIDKSFHKKDLFLCDDIFIEFPAVDFKKNSSDSFDSFSSSEIVKSYRVGVKNDLNEKLRFYIKNNKHVSKK